MIEFFFEASIALLVIVEPIGLVPMFILLAGNASPLERRKIALKATLVASVVLLLFAIAGSFLLERLHVSEQAFQIAGGLLLFITSIDLVIARPSGISSTTRAENEEARTRDDISVFPLAIPLIAGPGALTTIILLMRRCQSDPVLILGLVIILCAVMLFTLSCLLAAGQLSRILGITGTNVISRIAGILLAAISIQYIIDGLKSVFFLP